MTGPAHHVAVLVLPGVFPLELGIAAQIFGPEPRYRLTVCTPVPARSVPASGFTITATAGLDVLSGADTVVVPGYQDVDAAVPPGAVTALQAAHRRRARLVSICAGAFALAAAGLLDGRPATTHWQLTGQLQRRYPQIDVRPSQLYVDDGDILTSAGVTAGVDVCLHLIRTDHGAAAASACARALVAPPQRVGGQAQYIERLVPESSGGELAPLRDWMLETSPSRSASTRSPNAPTCPAGPSSAGSARRPEPRRWPGSPARASTAPVNCWKRPANPWNTSAASPGSAPPAGVRAAFHRHLGTSPQQYRTLFRHRTTSREPVIAHTA
jgi:transcriptional regulator GlxA family with amidase domain